MLIVKILLGLIGLGIIVFIHELGHFLAARLVGIDVEAFSIGWGKPIFAKKIGAVEYRLGMFPVGGYCKMRGQNDFQKAWESSQNSVAAEKGSFMGVNPFARILVAFAGPFFNLIFAAIVFSIVWGVGFEINTMDNKIVLVKDIRPEESYPADKAGLQSGDRIIEIDGKKIDHYRDIQAAIAVNAQKKMMMRVVRNNREQDIVIEPELEKSTGAGRIGVYFWADPIVQTVSENSPAAIAGIKSGDRILKVQEQNVPYTVALLKILDSIKTDENAGHPESVSIEIERNGAIINTELNIAAQEGESMDLGIIWQSLKFHTPSYSIFESAAKGFSETWEMLVVSVRSLALLFKGIDLTQAVSGPVRITYMAGDVATSGFSESVSAGLRSAGNFLALISIALAVMNLLPLPILDGGLIVIFLIEAIRRRPMNPRFISIFQTAGIVLIGGLMVLAVFGDILFLFRRG